MQSGSAVSKAEKVSGSIPVRDEAHKADWLISASSFRSWNLAWATARTAAIESRSFVTDPRHYSIFRRTSAEFLLTGGKSATPEGERRTYADAEWAANRQVLWKALYRQGKACCELGQEALRKPLSQENMDEATERRRQAWKCEC